MQNKKHRMFPELYGNIREEKVIFQDSQIEKMFGGNYKFMFMEKFNLSLDDFVNKYAKNRNYFIFFKKTEKTRKENIFLYRKKKTQDS